MPRLPCPDDETLARLADGTLSARAARTLGRHTEVCAPCHLLLVTLARVDLLSPRKNCTPSLEERLAAAIAALGGNS